MNTVLHKANTRGQADHGWLKVNHTFSFANYYNPERTNFGVLRVLNDDIISPAKGFPMHPHDNMEIITIPIKGALEHKDNMNNSGVIRNGEIQVMSAGKGIYHSEYNHSKEEDINLLQIWMFPNKREVESRYDQLEYNIENKPNELVQILSPNKDDAGVWIHQDAWFHLGKLKKDFQQAYKIKKAGNGVYIFVIEGNVQVGEQMLEKRDGYGVWNTDKIEIKANSNARILVMDVPMMI